MPKNKPSTAHTQTFVDPDEAPQLTPEWFAGADMHKGAKLVRRGRPPSPAKKQLVSLRLSPDVLKTFKAGGPGWQTRIDQALKEAAVALKPSRAKTSPRVTISRPGKPVRS